jgi:hypothetical protein
MYFTQELLSGLAEPCAIGISVAPKQSLKAAGSSGGRQNMFCIRHGWTRAVQALIAAKARSLPSRPIDWETASRVFWASHRSPGQLGPTVS